MLLREVGEFIKKHVGLSLLIAMGVLFYFFKNQVLTTLAIMGAKYGHLGAKVMNLARIGMVCCLVLLLIQHVLARQRFSYVRILPHQEDTYAYKSIISMTRAFYGISVSYVLRFFIGKPRYSFVIQTDEDGKVAYYLGADKRLLPQIIGIFFADNYKQAEILPVDKLTFPKGRSRFGFIFRAAKKKALPFQPFQKDIALTLADQLPPNSCLQVGFAPYEMKEFRKQISQIERDVYEQDGETGASKRLSRQKELLKDMGKRFQSEEVVYRTSIGISSLERESKRGLFNIFNSVSTVMNDSNRLKKWRLKGATQHFPVFYQSLILTGSELANVVHLPQLNSDKISEELREKVPHTMKGLLLADGVMDDPLDLYFGINFHPVIDDRFIYIQVRHINEHFVVTGKTGSGKSTVLNTLISKGFLDPFILEGAKKKTQGMTFLDPARDTSTTMLNWLLKAEADGEEINWEKIHYFKIAEGDYPIPMNLLAPIEGVSIDVQSDAIAAIINNAFENKAEVALRLLRYCVQTLLADTELNPDNVHTILEVPYLLDDETYRYHLLSRLNPERHYNLLHYWKSDAEENIKTSATAVKNRIDVFQTSLSMRRIFGQKDNRLLARNYMDEGHFLFFDVSNLSEKEITVIGGYVAYLYYRTAETRQVGSLMHLLLFDETHRFGNIPILSNIVAESRKFGLGLGISTQRLAQLTRDFRGTLKNVQNNFFVCQQGSEDSKTASEDIGNPYATPTMLEQLEPREVVVKYPHVFQDGEREQQYFLTKVFPLDKYDAEGNVVPFQDKERLAEVDAWTVNRALALMADRGYLTKREVDQAIYCHLTGQQPDMTDMDESEPTDSLFGL